MASEFDTLIDALNRIDEMADSSLEETYKEKEMRAKDYETLAYFIENNAQK